MAETVKTTHPVRGVLWGLMFGIGLTFVLVFTKVISLDLTTMIIVAVVATVLGTLWSIFGPAKAPKGPPPAEPVAVEQHEPSRHDGFDSPDEPDDTPIGIDTPADTEAEPVEDAGAEPDAGSDVER